MSSANQLYKKSGSNLGFKEWLRREQLKGSLDIHQDSYMNMVGDDDVPPVVDYNLSAAAQNAQCIVESRSAMFKGIAAGLVAGFLISKYIIKK